MKTTFIIFTSMALSFAAAHAEVQLQGTADELADSIANIPKLAVITGSAEVRTNANRARIVLLIATENRSLDSALAENSRVRQQLLESLASAGIGADQVENSDFASDQRRSVFSDKVKSYRIENHVIVSVRDGRQFQALAQRIDALPEAIVQSIEFDHTDEKALQRLATERALVDAGEQKAVYEKALKVRLTPRTFAPGGFAAMPQGVGIQGGIAPSSAFEFGKRSPKQLTPMGGSAEPYFAFGQLIFKADVTVQYSVEAAR